MNFSHSLIVFHGSFGDHKSPQFSKTIHCILANRNNAVVWMVSFNSFSKALRAAPSTPVTIGITVTLIFPSFLSSLARSKYLFFFLILILWSAGTAKNSIQQVLFFLLIIIIRSGLLVGVGWSVNHYYFALLRIFHTRLSGWFFTWAWVLASLQDSSKYSGRFYQYSSLGGLDSSSDIIIIMIIIICLFVFVYLYSLFEYLVFSWLCGNLFSFPHLEISSNNLFRSLFYFGNPIIYIYIYIYIRGSLNKFPDFYW